MPYTTLRCKTCARIMLEDNEPTPAEWAKGILDIGYDDEVLALMNHPQFAGGWLVGIEGVAEYDAHPFPMNDPEITPKRAWLFGMLCGEYSNHAGFISPVCYNDDPKYSGDDKHEDGEVESVRKNLDI